MQTFLPYPDYYKSLSCLDNKRLGNQVYREALTLIRGGWPNHPASKMWKGHEYHLALYSLAGLDALLMRGKDYPTHRETFEEYLLLYPNTGTPPWLGDEEFHLSHQSNLVRKDPEHYRQFFPDVPDDLDYVWPV